MFSPSLNAKFKLFKTTSPQKLFSSIKRTAAENSADH